MTSGTVTVLDAASDTDAAAWHDELARLPAELRDAYYLPAYVGPHVVEPEDRALLFSYASADDGDRWLYPFLLRPVPPVGVGDSRDGDSAIGAGYKDIENAYGYGGPLATTDDAAFLAAAHAAFSEWCQSERVIAEFLRLHPLLPIKRFLPAEHQLIVDRQTVSLTLPGLDSEKPPFDKKTRYMIRRAGRLGLRLETVVSDATFGAFESIYRATMQRLEATEDYYFTPDYFEGLRRLVEQNGWLISAWQSAEVAEGNEDADTEATSDQPVAAAIFLRGERLLHYHLSGADPEKRLPGLTNLLLLRAAELGRDAGLERLHLGGGTTATRHDSLLAFKRTMATDEHWFEIGKRVHDADVHGTLCETWREAHPELVERYGNRLLCYRYR